MSKPNKSGRFHDRRSYEGDLDWGDRTVLKGGTVHFDRWKYQHEKLLSLVGQRVHVKRNHVLDKVGCSAITVYPIWSRYNYSDHICVILVYYKIDDLAGKPIGHRFG